MTTSLRYSVKEEPVCKEALKLIAIIGLCEERSICTPPNESKESNGVDLIQLLLGVSINLVLVPVYVER